MSNLWTTAIGRATAKEGVYDIIRRRLGRRWGRNFVVEFDDWIQSGKTAFSFLDVIGDMNDAKDEELLNLYELLLQLGEAPVTYQDTYYVVNNLTGSDENGLGTDDSPFATVSHVLEMLRNTKIDHNIQIRLEHTAGAVQTVYIDDAWDLSHRRGKGSLVILGVGAPIETQAEQTLAARANLGSGGSRYTTVAAAPYIVDDWIGEFILVTSGAVANHAFPAHSNIANQVETFTSNAQPIAADTFKGVVPAVKVQLNQVSIRSDGLVYSNQPGLDVHAASVAIVNLDLDMSSSDRLLIPFSISSPQQYVNLEFVVLNFEDAQSYAFSMDKGRLNAAGLLDTTVQAATQSGVVNIGEDSTQMPGVGMRRATKAHGNQPMVVISNVNGGRLCTPDMLDPGEGGCVLTRICVNGINSSSRRTSPVSIIWSLLSNHGPWAAQLKMMDMSLNGIYIMAGTTGIIADGCRLWFDPSCECDPALIGYALEAGPNVQADMNGAPAAFVGVAGAINFVAPNPDVVAAWPAAGAIVGDALGGATVHSSWVAREG